MTKHEINVTNQEAEWRAHMARTEADRLQTKASIANAKRAMRPATSWDWKRYLSARSKPCTHFYNYDFNIGDEFYVAERDVDIPPACGAYAIHVIAIPGVKVTLLPGHTHCSVFRMDDPDAASLWVPSYNDAHQIAKQEQKS